MMHYGYAGGGHGGLWILMVVAMVVFWGALAWIVVTLVRHRNGPIASAPVAVTAPPVVGLSARTILDERFAGGDIDEEEYRRRRSVLDAPA